MGVYRELELEVGVARGLANKLRARHLEAYDLQGGPVAFADSSGIGKRLMMARMRLDEKLAANLPPDHAERTARMLLQRLSQEGAIERPSAPSPSPPEQSDASEGAWPWFSGRMEDLPWFRQAWETHVQRFHHGLAPDVLVGGMRKYCVPRGVSRMIEPALAPGEAWRILEAYFDRQTRILDELISDILSHEKMVNDSQTMAHYSRILMAIREAKEIGGLPDLLTDGRIKALMEIIPKKENNYWRQDQMGVRPKDMPVAFYSFIRARALELGSNASSMRVVRDDLDEQGLAWEGPCLMGDLCGGSHTPERCSLFMDLSPEDRLVVVQKKRLCYLCFRHADSQPCTLQSLPACSVGGCVRMHSKLLHEALQKEETRAIVIEVEEGPEEPGEDEEFYAANFELLGQGNEDEEEGMVSEDEAPPLVDSDEEPDEEPLPFAYLGEDRPRLCQQRVPLEVNGNLTSLHTLYDWESPNTWVRKESARRIGLQGVRAPRQAIKGYQGEGLITDSMYYLPLLDVDSNIQVIRAHGVDEIAVVARTRLPPVAREIFPVIRAYMPWMETGAGHVQLLIGLDNRQWLPAHVEDSWDPDDDIRLIKSVFGHRYMITDGWGRELLPPDNAQSGQADAQGNGVEAADKTQEVRLEEYRGWSQGTWFRENSGVQEATSPRGRCHHSSLSSRL
jgi:hypothetical protein